MVGVKVTSLQRTHTCIVTVLTGLGGMSEFTMMTQGIGWPHAYSLLVLILALIGYVTYVIVMKIGTPGSRSRSGGNSRKR